MSYEILVTPKYKAVGFTNRSEIIEAVKEINRLLPDWSKIYMLIDLFNEAHDTDMFTYNKFKGCGDCKRNLKKFWINVIAEWNKQ